MNVNDVAKHIIYLANKERLYSLTPLKLQKLLYYSQGFSYVWDNKALFNQEFEAWKYGPVNRDIYLEYQKYGEFQIPEYEGVKCTWPRDEIETINAVWRDYKSFHAFQLVDMTHNEDPWREAYNSGNSKISNQSIKEYFKRVYA